MERFAPPILIEVGQTCFMRRSGMFKMVKEKSEFITSELPPPISGDWIHKRWWARDNCNYEITETFSSLGSYTPLRMKGIFGFHPTK